MRGKRGLLLHHDLESWKCSASSPVNDILDKESFTLEELLQEDEILQEVKARNGRLIDL